MQLSSTKFSLAGAAIVVLCYWWSPTIAITVASGTIGILGANSLLRGTDNIRFNLADILFLTYFFTASVCLLLNGESLEILKSLIYPLVFYTLFRMISLSFRTETDLILILGLSLVLLSTILYFQQPDGSISISYRTLVSKQYIGHNFLGSAERLGPTVIGAPIVIALLCFIYCLSYCPLARSANIACALITAYLSILLVFSASRTALVAAVVGVLFITPATKNLNAVRFCGISIFLAGLALLVQLAIEVSTTNQRRFGYLLNLEIDKSMAERIWLWQEAVSTILAYPLGTGTSFFINLHGRTPHNELLGQLVSYGVVPAIALLFGTAYTLLCLNRNQAPIAKFCSATLISIVVISITENFSVSSANKIYPIVWLLLALSANKLQAPRSLSTSRLNRKSA